MKPKTSRVRPKGRIKKVISEWEAFWEDKQDYLATPVSWHDAIPELIHIAISLQKNEPEDILISLIEIKRELKKKKKIDWVGNLSTLVELIKQDATTIDIIKKTVFSETIDNLIVSYDKIFDVEVSNRKTLAYKTVFRAYYDINERHKATSLLCKFIITKFLSFENPDPFGLLNRNSREDILEEDNLASITAMWIPISTEYKIINSEFSKVIWNYNLKVFPFILYPDESEIETKKIETMKIIQLKNEFDFNLSEFKKIDLLKYIHRYVGEVFMGFIGRLHYLTIKIIEQEERHEGEIAEGTLRLLYENRVKFLWLNKQQDFKSMQTYREYKVGREKEFLDYIKERVKANPDLNLKTESIEHIIKQYMQSEGVDDYKLGNEKGDAFEKTVKDMADDLGDDEAIQYFAIYKRTSDIVHGNWRIVEKYHLVRSLNPAQDNLLRYKSSKNSFAGFLPSYLAMLISTDALIKFIELYEPILNDNKKLYNTLKKFHSKLNKMYLEEFGLNVKSKKHKDNIKKK
jgi:hypothetical protein